jgi:cell wall assembly regulator SMI1
MEDLLIRLESLIRASRPALLATLQPGVRPAELEKLEQSLGLQLPLGLKKMYLWRDEQRLDATECFQNGHYFLALAKVQEACEH